MYGKLFFSNKGIKWITFGWTGFILENLILSHNREYIINNYSDHNYHLTYNILSTIACSSIFYGYLRYGRGKEPLVNFNKVKSTLKRNIFISLILQSIGLIIVSQQIPKLQIPILLQKEEDKSLLLNNNNNNNNNSGEKSSKFKLFVRCPMDFRPNNDNNDIISGTYRISRHATFWSFGFICFGEALTSLFLPEVVMFSFPLLFAVIGTEHQDYRYRNKNGGILTPEIEKITSNIPFIALITGKQSWNQLYNEIKWVNASIGFSIALSLAFRNLKKLK